MVTTLGGQASCSSEVKRRTTQILDFLSAASKNLEKHTVAKAAHSAHCQYIGLSNAGIQLVR